jgi:hypothetical protein
VAVEVRVVQDQREELLELADRALKVLEQHLIFACDLGQVRTFHHLVHWPCRGVKSHALVKLRGLILDVIKEIRHLVCEIIRAVSDIVLAEMLYLRDIFIKDVSCVDLENQSDVLILNLVVLCQRVSVRVSAYRCCGILLADTLLKIVNAYCVKVFRLNEAIEEASDVL